VIISVTTDRITILVDNHAGDGLSAEHGLSLWIETDGRHILFDTGHGSALESNVRVLGVDLGETDVLVLSHGHYDHTGGIPYVLRHAPRAVVYCHPGVLRTRYAIRNGTARPIHIQQDSRSALEELPAERLRWASQALSISERIGVTGAIPRETSFEDTGGPFYLDTEGKIPDPIEDDLAIWIRTEKGAIVCAGCSHAGLVNTLNHVLRLSNGPRVRAVIGGFHLLNAGRDRLDQTIDALQSFEPDVIIPCHCTGEAATDALRTALGEMVSPGAAGMTFQF
jgi:7,8-dihydropterin-6-yl-methyl-4-(beta-D-ribofuranosyl)aminobenzene 5'-phosphate synthase